MPCDAPDLLARIADQVMELATEIAGPDAAGAGLQATVSRFSPSQVNRLLRETNNVMGRNGPALLGPFHKMIQALCGDSVLYQRRPYLRANMPGMGHTATEPHSDVFFGHSPYAYTMWIPLHDIDNDDGLFMYDRRDSQAILASYDFRQPLRTTLKHPQPRPLRLRFGEAIFFSCYLVHGANQAAGAMPRLSLDTRVQSAAAPLFEKGAELYGWIRP